MRVSNCNRRGRIKRLCCFCCRSWKRVHRRVLPFLSLLLLTVLFLWRITESRYFQQDFSIQACQLPNINYFDKSLKGAFWRISTINCTSWRAPVVWNSSGFLTIATNLNLGNVSCNYTGIEPDGDNYVRLSQMDRGDLPAKPTSDFTLVTCTNENSTFYRDLKHTIIPHRDVQQNFIRESNEQLSIILFGLDSVSRLVAENKLPLTLKFFRETLQSFDFTGYTKVGDNTLPNLLAALNGQTMSEALIPTFDFPPFFKYLQKAGYVTSYSEDWVPYYPPLGFKYPRYTHNLRTYFLAGEKYKPMLQTRRNVKDPKCFSNEFKHGIVIDHTDKFIRTYNDTLKASLSWINEIAHHQSNFLEAGDNHIKTFFERLYLEGRLSRTAVIFFSDHGPRYGKVVEKDLVRFTGRLPMLHIALPTHIREEYPILVQNLKTNTHRLTTPFDLHETLTDIIFQRYKEAAERTVAYPLPRGISLFTEVPQTRSCFDASISEHYCPCYTLTDVPISEPGPEMAAKFILDHINHVLVENINRGICARLKLAGITSAKQQNNNARATLSRSLVIVFSVSPGNGVFEGTVELVQNEVKQILGDINRLTQYKYNVGCMKDADLQMYCHCVNTTTGAR